MITEFENERQKKLKAVAPIGAAAPVVFEKILDGKFDDVCVNVLVVGTNVSQPVSLALLAEWLEAVKGHRQIT